MSPIITRIFLGLTLLVSIAVACFSFQGIQSGQNEAWATLAASLAVITSVVSAWGAQRVVELEEQKLEPYPYPHFDLTSHPGLIFVKITNFGGGPAYEIKLSWDSPLKDSKGDEINFNNSNSSGELAILLPGQYISRFVDGSAGLFEREGNHIYKGNIKFKDGKDKDRSCQFILDAGSYKKSPLFDNEVLKTHRELQKIPGLIQSLAEKVEEIAQQLKRDQDVDKI
ncbi:MAG: hypothetical protein HOP36_17365 [Methyloglobulus sp.]|nr:hypothetical protein [Methyloglobulus sp.]